MKAATGARAHAAYHSALYESDFFEWTQRTADQLRPSLRARSGAARKSNYAGAVERAAAESGLDLKKVPSSCPFSNDEIVDLRSLPE
jgi:hypothetical protein